MAAKGYRLRMDDGSEVGPMTLEAVEGWYRQGMVRHDNMVQRPDSYNWVPLSEILARDLKKQQEKERVQAKKAAAPAPRQAPAQARPRPKPAPAAPPEPAREEVTIDVPAGLWKGAIGFVLLIALAGGGFWAYRTFLQESEQAQLVRQWKSEMKAEPASGFQPPAGWVVLRSEQTLFAAPSEARLLLAHPRSGAFGFVISDMSPAGVGGLEQYLDLAVSRRQREALAPYKEEGRRDTALGGMPGREATTSWGSEPSRQLELVRVWKDGWNYNTLVGWATQGAKGDPAAAIAALASGVPANGVTSGQLAKVVDEVAREVPHFTRAVAEMLMAQSAAQVLEPQEAFRRGQALMSRGLGSLSAADSRELGALMQAIYGTLQARDRSRLAAYIDKVRARSLTTPQEDREMCFVMKGGVLKLPAARRTRLQAIFEKAVKAGLSAR